MRLILIGLICALVGCTVQQGVKGSVNFIGMLFGAIPEPQQTTLLQELTAEYDRCVATGGGPECAQQAYATVRKAKGLPEERLPTGIVIVREDKDDATVTIKQETSSKQP